MKKYICIRFVPNDTAAYLGFILLALLAIGLKSTEVDVFFLSVMKGVNSYTWWGW